MLKLKKLQIQGFKSFCERAELQFPGAGVVGIVGPNGCGKSNLADAIGWVLGEQSVKSLRGDRMEDVIFAGTRERPPTGMAEVSLTLVDPSEFALGAAAAGEPDPDPELLTPGWGDAPDEPSLPAEAQAPPVNTAAPPGAVILTIRPRRKFHARNRRGEILVTRRLYRDGQSEYLMNGRPCRLRDIQELFLGTGLGPESYAIIEQGRIGQILSSKPYDRRAIIEEAAGVSKYKAKRRLAEARLEAARQNLARINDIFEEVTRQVATLKRQSAKAERYRQCKQDYDVQQRQLLTLRGRALAAAAAELQAQRLHWQDAVAAAETVVEALEAERAAAQARSQGLQDQLRAADDAAARLRQDCERTRQQAAYDAQQAGELAARGQQSQSACLQSAQQREVLEVEAEQARADHQHAAAIEATAAAACERAQAVLGTAGQEESSAAAACDSARRSALELVGQLGRCERQCTQETARLEELERTLERVQREDAAARGECDAGGARRGQLELEFQEQQAEASQLQARLRQLEGEAAQLAAATAAAREQEQQARTRLAAAGARLRSLQEIAAGHGYSSEAVQRLFASGSIASSGVLGEFVEAEAPYDTLVEQFLHEELNYVVVGDWEQAGAGLALLRGEQRGRATFLVHPSASAPPDPAPSAPASFAGAVPLLDHMRSLNGFHGGLGALLPKLQHAYAVADAAQARQLAERHPQAYFLTPDGACYHRRTLSGGAGRSSGPLSLKRELRQLGRQEETEAAAADRLQQQVALLARQAEAVEREREQLRQSLQQVEAQRLSSTHAVRQLEAEQQRAQVRLAQAVLEAAQARAAQAAAAERLQQAEAAAALLRRRQTDLEAEQSAAAAATCAAQQARALAAQGFAAAQAEQARVEERARAAAAASQRIQRQLTELTQRMEQLQRDGAALAQRRLQLLAAAAAGEQRATSLAASLVAAEQAQAAAAGAVAASRAAVQEGDSQLRSERLGLEQRRQALSENQIAAARLAADGEHLRQTCRDDLACELEALLLAAPEPPEAADPAALEASVRTLRQRIENLGPINMMALEEFEEARRRHECMETQRRDLLDSIADTYKAIQEMDAVSRQKFDQAFARINEYFQETFRLLFGGGQGFLRMSEMAEGAAEAGVDIVAQPPGKKLQNALLLSGGEKAMTAMALLLAVFRYQPSPFCLLDEVDAPMDEANVARFAEMVRSMSAQTQFILITHNKRTMESAGTLYGVTMPQPGCSRLVSVLMEEAVEIRADEAAAS